jgi:hypothetical protein
MAKAWQSGVANWWACGTAGGKISRHAAHIALVATLARWPPRMARRRHRQ